MASSVIQFTVTASWYAVPPVIAMGSITSKLTEPSSCRLMSCSTRVERYPEWKVKDAPPSSPKVSLPPQGRNMLPLPSGIYVTDTGSAHSYPGAQFIWLFSHLCAALMSVLK